MYEDEKLMTFTLDQDGVITSKTLRNKDTWFECLQEFLYFLEGAGFTDVRKRVAIDTGVFTAEDLSWYGPTFEAESKVPDSNLSNKTKADNEGWITWDGQLEGDEIPHGLNKTDRVFVMYRVGQVTTVASSVGGLDWSHEDHNCDIVAYKVI